MLNKPLKVEHLLALSLAATSLFCVGTTARAQSSDTQRDSGRNFDTTRNFQDNDSKRANLAQFDRFLDAHPEIAEQVRKDPSLAENDKFLKTHPALQAFLQDQPAIRQDLRQNPNAFMRQEDAFAPRDNQRENQFDRDAFNRRNLAQFDQFLDTHREVSEQLHRDPALADNQQYLKDHPDLQAFLQDRPEIRQDLRDNPRAYIREENAFDRREDLADRSREQRAEFDRFLDSHPETAEQLRKNPSLADNDAFLKTHPALQTYLRDQPGVRQDLRNNPNAFLHQTDAFDHRDYGRDRGLSADQSASFREFLGGHATINDQLSRDPTLVKNHEYVQNHPELQAYLNTHPDVRDHLMQNPHEFANNSQQNQQQYNKKSYGDNSSGYQKPSATTSTPPPTAAPTPAPTPTPAPAPTPAPNPTPAPSPAPHQNPNPGSRY